jgi:hypothetical protein
MFHFDLFGRRSHIPHIASGCVEPISLSFESIGFFANRISYLSYQAPVSQKSIPCAINFPKCQESRNVAANSIPIQAKLHGNEPSRGAKVDKEIAEEEAEMISKKEAKKK